MCLWTHNWKEESRHFCEPLPSGDLSGTNPKTLFKIVNGYTVIVMKCRKCGYFKDIEVMGEAKVT